MSYHVHTQAHVTCPILTRDVGLCVQFSVDSKFLVPPMLASGAMPFVKLAQMTLNYYPASHWSRQPILANRPRSTLYAPQQVAYC